jgi:hypothetical protein
LGKRCGFTWIPNQASAICHASMPGRGFVACFLRLGLYPPLLFSWILRQQSFKLKKNRKTVDNILGLDAMIRDAQEANRGLRVFN